MFVNDWDINDPWDAIFTYAPHEDGVAWAEAGAGFAPAKSMWAQKMGNSPEQWEDAFALNEAGGAAAIADGAVAASTAASGRNSSAGGSCRTGPIRATRFR